MFKLSGLKTYVTLHKKFKEGQLYTAEQLEGLIGALNESGTPLFVEVDESEVSQSEESIAEEVGLTEVTEEVEVVEEVEGGEEKAPRKLIVGKKKEA